MSRKKKKTHGETKKSGLPTDFQGQVDLVVDMVEETASMQLRLNEALNLTDGCIESVFVDEDDTNNLSITIINRQSGKSTTVNLVVPGVLDRGEYFLWTEEGTFDLGKFSSEFGINTCSR